MYAHDEQSCASGENIRFLISGIILTEDFTPLLKEINNDYSTILK